ncbi:MAG: hypothetical protein NUV76_08985, partial [Candidatus Kuenenia sp.]|nr:hypothetical protein [Candidatus Kuenenia sp.]
NELCQKVVPAEDKGMKELFKYFTKIITEGNPIPPENLDEIFCAIRGMHTVRPFGFKVSLPEDPDDIEFDVEKIELAENEYIELFGWEQELHDWVSKQTGEMLSGYEPSEQFELLVKQFEKKG